MKEIWTRHLKDPEDKERFKQSIHKATIDRLNDIVDKMLNDLERAEVNPQNYELPNWDYRQAHNNGYRQALILMKTLLEM